MNTFLFYCCFNPFSYYFYGTMSIEFLLKRTGFTFKSFSFTIPSDPMQPTAVPPTNYIMWTIMYKYMWTSIKFF